MCHSTGRIDFLTVDHSDATGSGNPTAIENMKFTECLSPELAAEVYCSRFNDIEAVRKIVGETKKVLVE